MSKALCLAARFQESRGLNHVLRANEVNAEGHRDGIAKGEGKDLEGRFGIETFSEDTVDMRENEINSVLGEIIERRTRGDDVTEESMILFDPGFLRRRMGITEEEGRFLDTVEIVFEGKDIGEFAAIISKDYGEDGGEGKAGAGEAGFEIADGLAGNGGGFVIQKDTEHEIAKGEIKGQDNLAAGMANEEIHFDPMRNIVLSNKVLKAVKSAALFEFRRHIIFSRGSAGFELDDARQVDWGDREIPGMKVPVEGRFRDGEVLRLENVV